MHVHALLQCRLDKSCSSLPIPSFLLWQTCQHASSLAAALHQGLTRPCWVQNEDIVDKWDELAGLEEAERLREMAKQQLKVDSAQVCPG